MTATGQAMLRRAFGQPAGLLGRLGGFLMTRGNGATERQMVVAAELRAGETVVVVGPGPGVGVRAVVDARAGRVIALDPSVLMLDTCRRRCGLRARQAGVTLELVEGAAAESGLATGVADAVLSVNNVMIWPDRAAGFAELFRVLRPGGRLLISAHDRWLDGGGDGLAADARDAGFTDVTTWTWQPPGRGASLASQLRATRPR